MYVNISSYYFRVVSSDDGSINNIAAIGVLNNIKEDK